MKESCARCHAPLDGELYSTALHASFCGYPCYDAAWRERFSRTEKRGGLPVQDDVDYYDCEGTPDGAKEPEVVG